MNRDGGRRIGERNEGRDKKIAVGLVIHVPQMMCHQCESFLLHSPCT